MITSAPGVRSGGWSEPVVRPLADRVPAVPAKTEQAVPR